MILETAKTTLLAPFDLEAQKLERVFGTLAARRVDYADLYFQYSRYEGWSLEEGIVKSGSFNIEQGVGVRAISGEKTAFAYSDEISFAALQDAAKATRAIAAAGQAKRTKVAVRRTPAASVPSARAMSTTSYSPPRLAMTWVMRGSSARHLRSSFSSSFTLSTDSSEATGLIERYRGTGTLP